MAKMINISENESIYLMTKSDKELMIIGEKDIYKEGEYVNKSMIPSLQHLSD